MKNPEIIPKQLSLLPSNSCFTKYVVHCQFSGSIQSLCIPVNRASQSRYKAGIKNRFCLIKNAVFRTAPRSSRAKFQILVLYLALKLIWIICAIVMRSLSNSSKSRSSCGRVGLNLNDNNCWNPSYCAKKVFKHMMPCISQARVMTDQVDGWATSNQ